MRTAVLWAVTVALLCFCIAVHCAEPRPPHQHRNDPHEHYNQHSDADHNSAQQDDDDDDDDGYQVDHEDDDGHDTFYKAYPELQDEGDQAQQDMQEITIQIFYDEASGRFHDADGNTIRQDENGNFYWSTEDILADDLARAAAASEDMNEAAYAYHTSTTGFPQPTTISDAVYFHIHAPEEIAYLYSAEQSFSIGVDFVRVWKRLQNVHSELGRECDLRGFIERQGDSKRIDTLRIRSRMPDFAWIAGSTIRPSTSRSSSAI